MNSILERTPIVAEEPLRRPFFRSWCCVETCFRRREADIFGWCWCRRRRRRCCRVRSAVAEHVGRKGGCCRRRAVVRNRAECIWANVECGAAFPEAEAVPPEKELPVLLLPLNGARRFRAPSIGPPPPPLPHKERTFNRGWAALGLVAQHASCLMWRPVKGKPALACPANDCGSVNFRLLLRATMHLGLANFRTMCGT